MNTEKNFTELVAVANILFPGFGITEILTGYEGFDDENEVATMSRYELPTEVREWIKAQVKVHTSLKAAQSPEKLTGIIEADETYIGGNIENTAKNKMENTSTYNVVKSYEGFPSKTRIENKEVSLDVATTALDVTEFLWRKHGGSVISRTETELVAESDSEHPLAKDMREAMKKVNSFKNCTKIYFAN